MMSIRLLVRVTVVLAALTGGLPGAPGGARGQQAAAVYYVDPGGDDAKDGLAPERAWRSLQRVSTATLSPGDKALFRRGGQWRGQLVPQSGSEAAPITYGAYGEGEKPALLGSVAMDDPSDWQPVGPNLWTTAAASPASEGTVRLPCDVGNIIFDHGAAWGVKKWREEDLKADLDYYYDQPTHGVTLFSKDNPARRFKSCELALREHVVLQSQRHHVVYENLAVRYGAAHGIGGGNTHHITVRGCDFSWIGGGHQFTRPDGVPVRFGNGVEFWGNAHDCLVEGCRLWEIYDAALTNQNSGAVCQQYNITYRHNVIWNCEYSFEYWNRPEASLTHHVYFENNTCFGAGRGWGHAQRPDPSGRHLCFYTNDCQTHDLSIRSNIFCGAAGVAFDALWWKPETMSDRQVICLDHNCWWQPEGEMIRLRGKSYTQAEFAAYQRDTGQEAHSLAADPRLADPAKRDFHLLPDSPCLGAGADLGHPADSDRRPIPRSDSFPEARAAQEFAQYAGQITGSTPATTAPGVFDLEGGRLRVLVGRTAATQSLVDRGVLRVPGDLGEEGFLIRALEDGGQKHLVLLGGSPRAALYAVYHYLEHCCRVGFFSDGEQVPRLERMPAEGLDLVERPRWPMREYMMDCEYTSYWWGPAEWKQEVDWAAKHKFNVLSSNFDFTATWRKVWKRFGVEVPPESLSAPPFHPWAGWHNWAIHPPYPEPFQQTQADLARRFVEYGRSLGMKMAPDFRGFLGQVPREFHEKYRDRARFIEVGWGGFDPPGVFIHPADPLYAEVAKAFAEEFLKEFGTDHLWPGQTFCEMEPAKDRAETLAIEIALLKRDLEAIRAVDPEAVLFTTSWTFLGRSREHVKAFLDALPDGAVQVWEMPSDLQRGEPQYRQLDYFHGKPWLFGFLYSYGGTTMLHGDLADLIKRAQDVAADPKAGKCLGMAIQPEALRHNPIAFDLLSRAGWDPSALDLNGFLEDYAVRRYGKDAAPKMVECLKELSASVYGQPGVECPLYMFRITPGRFSAGSPHGGDQAARFLPHLEKALEAALSESGRLGASPMYQHDLVDIGRQYLSDLFNLHAAGLAKAFEANDREAFGREASALRQVLASQEMLLSSSDAYCLAPILAKAKALPGAPENYDERIRDILTVWGGKILDYAHRDYYELVRFYYRPRVEAFLDHAEKRLGQPLTPADDEQLNARYHAIEQAWVKQPFRVAESERYAGGPAQAAAEVLRKHRLSEAVPKSTQSLQAGTSQ